jgi:hypothetical protein
MLRKEAVHASGSPPNFVGKVLTAEQVGDACMKALDTCRRTYAPYSTRDHETPVFRGSSVTEPAFAKVGERAVTVTSSAATAHGRRLTADGPRRPVSATAASGRVESSLVTVRVGTPGISSSRARA